MTATEFSSFLNSISSTPLSVLDASIALQHYIPLDLSVSNKNLQNVDVSSSSALELYINQHIQAHDGKVAYGGYNERRNIYQRSQHFNENDPATERNIHLGMDLWLAAGAPVFTPMDGTVHSFKNNTKFGDYGPTLILKHGYDGLTFYTLYGHLSLDSIASLNVGQGFEQGSCVATLGDASVNGDYPPHLHFQLIRDIGDFMGDYPGVASQQDVGFYLENCPNPNLLLKLG